MFAVLVFVLVLVLMFVSASAIAQTDANGYQEDAFVKKLVDSGAQVSWISIIATAIIDIAPMVIAGGGVAIAVIVILQYIGVDLIGWTVDFFKFIFETAFTILRWTLASEAQLISMAILFMAFWFFVLYILPSLI